MSSSKIKSLNLPQSKIFTHPCHQVR